MTEKISEKKLVSRNVAIGLVLICIVLSAGLVGAVYYYVSLSSQIAEKDSTIASLNSQVSSLQATINQSSSQLQALTAQYQALTTQYQETVSSYNEAAAEFNALLALAKSGLLVSELPAPMVANSTFPVWNNVVEYAGYVVINVQSSSNTTYAQVVYTSSAGVSFNGTTIVGTSGTAAFPVLPGPIGVFVGNTESTDNVTATVTATYYY
jgi:uncharacterized coiled-coil protein SlyX